MSKLQYLPNNSDIFFMKTSPDSVLVVEMVVVVVVVVEVVVVLVWYMEHNDNLIAPVTAKTVQASWHGINCNII